MDKKIGHSNKEAAPNKKINFNDTSATNQQKIALLALREAPKTTIELRHYYGIMQPAPRIKELRMQGYDILTIRITSNTPDGIKHRAVAKYVLRGERDE